MPRTSENSEPLSKVMDLKTFPKSSLPVTDPALPREVGYRDAGDGMAPFLQVSIAAAVIVLQPQPLASEHVASLGLPFLYFSSSDKVDIVFYCSPWSVEGAKKGPPHRAGPCSPDAPAQLFTLYVMAISLV